LGIEVIFQVPIGEGAYPGIRGFLSAVDWKKYKLKVRGIRVEISGLRATTFIRAQHPSTRY
jgi:hypothetical protein